MGASIAMPEPVEEPASAGTVDSGPELTLSVTEWDPSATAFSEPAVAAVRERTEAVLRDVTEHRQELEAAGPALGLTRQDVGVAVPPDWPGTPGSPVYYLMVAEGFLRAAAAGTICRDDFPESPFSNDPPPPDRWTCAHEPPHQR